MSAQADWRLALPGWSYEFPRDHQNHPSSKQSGGISLETSTPPMVVNSDIS